MLDRSSRLCRESAPVGERPLVESVRFREANPREGGFDRMLGWFWSLMLTKCLLCTWAVGYWDMPISSFWVWLPSLVFGGVCTLLYVQR